MFYAEIDPDLVMWVNIKEDGSYDKKMVEFYANALANAIQVKYQLEAFSKAGVGVEREE